MHMRIHLVLLILWTSAAATFAQTPPCRPCSGLVVESPTEWREALAAEPRLTENERLYVAWSVDLDTPPDPAPLKQIVGAGATPWLILRFTVSAPLREHLETLDHQLQTVAEIARTAPATTHFQVDWQPSPASEGSDWDDYRFLLKRASVTIAGIHADAPVLTRALVPDTAAVDSLYAGDVAAYVDGVVLRPSADDARRSAVLERLQTLDPGKPVIVEGVPEPSDSRQVLAEAARQAASGVTVTLFTPGRDREASLHPLFLLAREFQGDLSFDPYSSPELEGEAWSFVRGKDLGLRVIVAPRNPGSNVRLNFSDPQLQSPERVRLDTLEPEPVFGLRRSPSGLSMEVEDAPSAFVLRIERGGAAALEGVSGVEARVDVQGTREIPVEEILRRLQAFEDAQARRLHHFRATNTTHLRFQGQGTNQTIEATFQGPYFVDDTGRTDWAWSTFYVNGVRWRGKTIPELPLVQPEKAAAMPLQILFTREYSYRLKGTDTVDGRDCWVVEFEPVNPESGKNLFKGTVWIDRKTNARLKTKALQVGLTGEVISNEETIDYRPVDPEGKPSEWDSAAYVLPLHTLSYQIFSVLNSTLMVEREAELTDLRINDDGFDTARLATLDSDATMVRDTEKGLRYLVKDKASGTRVVKEGYKKNRLFAAAGIFADDSLRYPLPLGGIDYFSFDFRGTGSQLNFFFAGALLNATISDPNLFGSRFDGGASAFAIAVPFTNSMYRQGREQLSEEVQQIPARVSLSLGHPVGGHGKLELNYGLEHHNYQRTSNTSEDFVLPSDHFEHSAELEARYSRGGYRLRARGAVHSRSRWDFWGLPDSTFDTRTKSFTTWGASLAKNYHLKSFQRIGVEAEYVGGRNLDRFSKYGFGFFSGARVHGYQSGKVRAEEAWATHVSYGFDLGDVFRLDLIGDAAWATDKASGLKNELLAGAGVSGTFIGPWQTIVNLDLGVPVAGPDSGFTAYIVFLKLFK